MQLLDVLVYDFVSFRVDALHVVCRARQIAACKVLVFYLGKYKPVVGNDGLPLISDIVVAAKLHHQISQQAVVVGLQYPVQLAGEEVRKDFLSNGCGEYVRFVDTFNQQFDLFRSEDRFERIGFPYNFGRLRLCLLFFF